MAPDQSSMSRPGVDRRRRILNEAGPTLFQLANTSSVQKILVAALDLAEEMTESRIGFFHFIEDDQKSIWLQAWSTNTVANMCTAEGAGAHYPIEQAGVWADCIRHGRPTVHNDYGSVAGRKGLPPGHAPIHRELVVPVSRAGRIAAVLGVGNKLTDYTDEDLAALSTLADLAWDIASRKRSEEALKASEARLRAYFDSPAVGIAITSPGKGWIDVNERTCTMLGYTRDELFSSTWLELTHPDDVGVDVAEFNKVLAGEIDRYSLDKRFLRKDGTTLWTLLSVSCVRRPDRSVDCFVAILNDITERKQAEQALAETRSILQAAMDQSPAGIAIADAPSGKLRYVNDAGLLIRGLDRETVVNGVGVDLYVASWQILDLDGTPLAPDAVPLARAILYGEKNSRQFIIRRSPTDDRVVLAKAAPVTDAQGTVTSAVVVFVDITDQKRAEQALRASEAHFRQLVTALPIPIAFCDSLGRVVTLNERLTQVLGYTQEDIPTMDEWFRKAYPEERYRGEVIEGWGRRVRKAIEAGGDIRPREVRVTCKSGDVRTMSISGVPVGEDLLVTMIDVTEARSLQDRLALAERLAALGTLVAGVAHEINNPLAAVLSGQVVAREVVEEILAGVRTGNRIDPGASEAALAQALEALDDAQEGGERIASIIRDLTALGRPGAKRSRARLAEVVSAAMQWLPATVAHRATVTVEDLGAPDVVAAAGQVEQVLVNLVTNAANATPAGKRDVIQIRLGPGTPGMARLEVIDHGSGISPATLRRIFEPFFTTRPVGKGTGLGLAICHAIVTAHGGTLTVETEVGGGSTFRVELPAAPAEA
jgi:PAS domain S-box-containing protein